MAYRQKFCSADPPLRDERLGRPVDGCWLVRWLKIYSFYPLLHTVYRRLTYKDLYNTLPELYPENVYKKYERWHSARPNWSVGQICFRIVFWEMMLAYLFAMIAAGLKMGCSQLLTNVVAYITSAQSTPEAKAQANKNIGIYIMLFVIRVVINQQSSRLIYMAAIKVEVLLNLKIYDKLIRVSKTYSKHLKEADILYLFKGDTRIIYDFIRYSASLFSGITTLILAQIFLYIRLKGIGMILLPILVMSMCLQILLHYRKSEILRQKLPFFRDRLAMNISFYDQITELKSMGWEEVMMRKNKQARSIENKKHVAFFIYQNLYLFIIAFIPCLVMTLYMFAARESGQLNQFSPRRAYTIYTFLLMIQGPLRSFPLSVVNAFQAFIAGKHIANFLQAQEVQNTIDESLEPGTVIIDNVVASIEDPKSIARLVRRFEDSKHPQSLTLVHLLKEAVSKQYQSAQINNPEFKYFNLLFRDLSIGGRLEFKKGDRVIILTSDVNFNVEILKAIIGHLKIQKGSIKYNGKIGYIKPEEFHFLRESIKNNIVFKGEEDPQKLEKIYRMLDMNNDFERLEKGADTVVTDSNILLSVEEKKKIALAKALYFGADILLLDRYFQGLEPDETMELYQKYCRVLRNKLLMITSKTRFFVKPEDKIIIMEYGKLIEFGTYSQLLANVHSKIHQFTAKNLRKIYYNQLVPQTHRIMKRLARPLFEVTTKQSQHTADTQETGWTNISGCPVTLQTRPSKQQLIQNKEPPQSERLINLVAEVKEKPAPPPLKSSAKSPYISFKHYLMFFRNGSLPLYALTILLIISSQGVRIFSDWWIGAYSASAFASQNVIRFIVSYIIICLVAAVVFLIAGLISPFISAITTENIMSGAMDRLFYADLSVFRRINRLAIAYLISKDNEDFYNINEYFFSFLRNILLFLGTIIIMGLTSWPVFIVGGVLFICNLFMMYLYRKSSMEILDLGDPFRTQYNQMLEDIMLTANTIRTQEKQSQFRKSFMNAIYYVMPVYKMNSRYCSHGLSLFGQLVTVIIVATIGFLIVDYRSKNVMSATMTTLSSTSISLSSRLSGYILQAAVDWVSFSSNSNVSIKILMDKIKALVPNYPQKTFPKNYHNLLINNSIRLENVSYKSSGEKLDLLQNVNLNIKGNSLVGFYTGFNGDLQALFNLVCTTIKPVKDSKDQIGKIYIGNRDTSQYSQKDILSNVMFLGTQPVLLNGTLRQNIDPYFDYTDEQIMASLKEVQFWEELGKYRRISLLPHFGSLDFYIYHQGKQLPLGCKEKINIARAILQKPAILILYGTLRNVPLYMKDALREAIYRNLRKTTTILMATLEIPELLKCDYLVGLENGKIKEQGTPAELLQNPQSRLSKMVDLLIPDSLIQNRRELLHLKIAQLIEQIIRQAKYYH